MEVHISGRGVAISPALRRRVEAKIAKVARFVPKITEVRVVLGLERYRHLAEVTLHAKGATLHAEGAAGDFHAAVDLAVENLSAQARRRKDRISARKPRLSRRPRAASASEPSPDAPVEAAAPDLVIRRLAAKPMTVDEAVEQIQDRTDGVLVFTNARSRAVNVLRRRPDGHLELVQPAG
jgi:putative sigma-54 modulation protein